MRPYRFARLATILALLAGSALPSHAASVPVSGEGTLITGYVINEGETTRVFAPTHAIAVRTRTPDRVWLLLTERDASELDWAGSNERVDKLQAWCKAENAAYVLFELSADGVPELVHTCSETRATGTAMISNINGLASVVPTWEVFGPERLRGRVLAGKGYCGDGVHCEVTGDYTVDVAVSE